MKLVIASGIYPPDIGGPATYSQIVAKEFSKRGIDVRVICYSDKKGGDVIRVLRKYPLPVRYFLYFWNLSKVARRCDIIYALGPINSGLPAILVGKILRKKVALRFGGDYIWEKVSGKKGVKITLRQYYESGLFEKQGFIFKIFKWVLKSVDLVIFSTKFQRDIYLQYLGLKKDKTIVIKNAFPDFEEIPRHSFNSNYILFAGRIDKLKNLDFLIEVFSKIIPETSRNIQLRIVGDGSEKERLQKLTKELRLEKKVVFESKVSHRKLLEIIQGCYFAVLPSLTEISPNFVLECIKLDKPILCTRETGLYEDFKNNLVFFDPCNKKDFFEKFKWLLKDDNYIKYQNKIKSINTKRSWSELAEEHLLVFRELK